VDHDRWLAVNQPFTKMSGGCCLGVGLHSVQVWSAKMSAGSCPVLGLNKMREEVFCTSRCLSSPRS